MKQLWSDALTSRLNSSSQVRNVLGALLFGTAVWFSGLLAFGLSGLTLQYVGSPFGYGFSFLFIPYMLVGISYLHSAYLEATNAFRKHLSISDHEFESLRAKLHGLVLNNWIMFGIALVLVILFDDDVRTFVGLLAAGRLFTVNLAFLWSNGLSLLNLVLLTTGLWLVANIWYGIYSIAKAPLSFKPVRFMNQFRPLSRLNLIGTSFYFTGLAIPGVLNLLYAILQNSPLTPSEDIYLVLYFLLLVPGIVGFLAPHFVIHRTLKRAKEEELQRIDKEIKEYVGKIEQQQALEEPADINGFLKFSSHQIWLYSHLYALQATEHQVAEAQDWTLDQRMLSLFILGIIIPSATNLISSQLVKLILH